MLATASLLQSSRPVKSFDRNTDLEFIIYSHFVRGRGGLVGSSSSSSGSSGRRSSEAGR